MMKKLNILILLFFLSSLTLWSQENEFSNKTYNIGFGIGANEIGIGRVYQFGIQKTSKINSKFRYGFTGQFVSVTNIFVTDVKNQMEHTTSLDYRLAYDLVKYKSISLFLQTAPFINYTRGLIGTGGEFSTGKNGFYRKIVGGGLAGLGIRIDNPKKSYAIEINPLTIHYGYAYSGKDLVNHEYYLGYFQINVNFKQRNK